MSQRITAYFQSRAVQKEGPHFTSQQTCMFCIVLVWLCLIVFICRVTCHMYILVNHKPLSLCVFSLPVYQWPTVLMGTNCDAIYFSYCRLFVLQVRLVGRQQAEGDIQAQNLITETRILM